jgi:carboxymethylenebutenolidase
MPEEIKELLQDYQDGKITRRDFIAKAVAITGSLAAANALLGSFFSSPLQAAQVDPNDPELASEMVQFPGRAGNVYGYLSRPKTSGRYPATIVVHEWNGLNEHIRDVTRRFAKEGYVALAPDYLSRHGGTPVVNPQGAGLRNIGELAPAETMAEDSDAGFNYLKSLPQVRSDRVGLVGFCWGGGGAFFIATQVRGLKAVVVYYGVSPGPLDLVKNIEAPVLAHYGSEDSRVNAGIAATEEAMKKYNKSYTYKIFAGGKHAFNNDERPAIYHPEAAKEAWSRTLEFFSQHLKG